AGRTEPEAAPPPPLASCSRRRFRRRGRVSYPPSTRLAVWRRSGRPFRRNMRDRREREQDPPKRTRRERQWRRIRGSMTCAWGFLGRACNATNPRLSPSGWRTSNLGLPTGWAGHGTGGEIGFPLLHFGANLPRKGALGSLLMGVSVFFTLELARGRRPDRLSTLCHGRHEAWRAP